MKQEFLNFLNELMIAAPEVTERLMTKDIEDYIKILEDNSSNKNELTDNGRVILKYLQDTDSSMLKAKDIGEGLFLSSRTVSGSMRKLVADGFVEKIGKDPAIYKITEKGKNYNI